MKQLLEWFQGWSIRRCSCLQSL